MLSPLRVSALDSAPQSMEYRMTASPVRTLRPARGVALLTALLALALQSPIEAQ